MTSNADVGGMCSTYENCSRQIHCSDCLFNLEAFGHRCTWCPLTSKCDSLTSPSNLTCGTANDKWETNSNVCPTDPPSSASLIVSSFFLVLISFLTFVLF
jgi:hypothetical protein